MRPKQGEAPLNSLGRGGPGDATTSPGPSPFVTITLGPVVATAYPAMVQSTYAPLPSAGVRVGPDGSTGPPAPYSTQVPCFGARGGRGAVRRFDSVQPRRCMLPTSTRLSHTIGRSHDHRASVSASSFPMVSRPHSTSGGSGFRDVCSSGPRERTVLGRLLGRTPAAAATPTAVQSLRRLLG